MEQNTFRFSKGEEDYQIVKILNPKNVLYDYIIYTNDGTNLYASRYRIVNNRLELSPIKEEYEWNYLDKYLEGGQNEA